ncbi:MAG: TetR/AcrR family transcriptional regulator [Methanomassiliicoccales archaeon]|nr:TetR/AcrR family transcriptional regulator [Methanomassiliicoccales archaeon]
MAKEERSVTSTRDRILDAALEAFGTKGFAATTTKEIARSAGVNEVTMFRIFGSKLKLFQSVMEERSLLRTLKEGISFDPERPLDDLLYDNIRFVLSTLRRNKHMFMLMLGDASRMPEIREAMGSLMVEKGLSMLTGFMGMLIEQGRLKKMDPEIAARTIMGLVQSYFIMNDVLLREGMDEEREEQVLRGYVSVLLDGMRGQAA